MDKRKYCVFGLGNVGILFSYFLRSSTPLLISRRAKGSTAEITIRKSNFVWRGVFDLKKPEDEYKCEVLFLAVKAYDVETCLKVIGNKAEYLVLPQNGLGIAEIAMKFFPKGNVFMSPLTYGLTGCGDNCTEIKGEGEIVLGQYEGLKLKDVALEIAETLRNGGATIRLEENIVPFLWLKAIINTAINPLTAILNRRNGFIIENENAFRVAEMLAREAEAVASSLNIKLPEDPIKAIVNVAMRTKDNFSSMLQDVRSERRTEIDYISGYFVKAGKELGIDVRANETIYHIIKALTLNG